MTDEQRRKWRAVLNVAIGAVGRHSSSGLYLGGAVPAWGVNPAALGSGCLLGRPPAEPGRDRLLGDRIERRER